MTKDLRTVAQFAAETVFTEPQLRWMVFCAATNGLQNAGAVKRIGRRVYIDVSAFDQWVDAQQAPGAERCQTACVTGQGTDS